MAIKYWNYSTCNIDAQADIGDECIIHCHVTIHRKVKIGKRSRIQCGVKLFDGVTIEDDVFIGPGAIITNDPDPAKSIKETWKPTPTVIKKGAIIGAGVLIRAGVVIGEEAEIGMGSVVLQNIPEGQVWVGNPARFLRYRKVE